MKYKKPLRLIFFLALLISSLFISIPFIKINNVNAASDKFTIKDNFESNIENKVYTELTYKNETRNASMYYIPQYEINDYFYIRRNSLDYWNTSDDGHNASVVFHIASSSNDYYVLTSVNAYNTYISKKAYCSEEIFMIELYETALYNPHNEFMHGRLQLIVKFTDGSIGNLTQYYQNYYKKYRVTNSLGGNTYYQFAMSRYLIETIFSKQVSEYWLFFKAQDIVYLSAFGSFEVYSHIQTIYVNCYNTFIFIPRYDIHLRRTVWDWDEGHEYYDMKNNTDYKSYKYLQKLYINLYQDRAIRVGDSSNNYNSYRGYVTLFINNDTDLRVKPQGLSESYWRDWNPYEKGRLIINARYTSNEFFELDIDNHGVWLEIDEITIGRLVLFDEKRGLSEFYDNINDDITYWNDVFNVTSDSCEWEDFAQKEIGDAWDFEEGDNEGVVKHGTQVYNVVVSNGKFSYDTDHEWKGIRLDYNYIPEMQDVNTKYWNALIFRAKGNISYSQYWSYWFGYNGMFQFSVAGAYVDTDLYTDWHTYVILFKDIPTYNYGKINEIRIHSNGGASVSVHIEIDYIRLVHYIPSTPYKTDLFSDYLADGSDFDEGDAEGWKAGTDDTIEINTYGHAKLYTTSLTNDYILLEIDDSNYFDYLMSYNFSIIRSRVYVKYSCRAYVSVATDKGHLLLYSKKLLTGINVFSMMIDFRYDINEITRLYLKFYDTEGTTIDNQEIYIDYVQIYSPEQRNSVLRGNSGHHAIYSVFTTSMDLKYDTLYYNHSTVFRFEFAMFQGAVTTSGYVITTAATNKYAITTPDKYTYIPNFVYEEIGVWFDDSIEGRSYPSIIWTDLDLNGSIANPLFSYVQTYKYITTNISSEKAYEGLRSYYISENNLLNYTTYIEIPSIALFPQKISFFYYTMTDYPIKFYINTMSILSSEYMMFNIDAHSNYQYISEVIQRENYYVNPNYDGKMFFYFKNDITLLSIVNGFVFSIDNLEITYTNPSTIINTWYDAQVEERYIINASSGGIEIQPRKFPSYNQTDSRVYYYHRTNRVFTRRIYIESLITTNESNSLFKNQTSIIKVYADYNYTFIVSFILLGMGSSSVDYNLKYSLKILKEGSLFYQSTNTTYDYSPIYTNAIIKIQLYQKDYNTLFISGELTNKLTGNDTIIQPTGITINDGNIKNNVITAEVLTIFKTDVASYFVPIPEYYKDTKGIVYMYNSAHVKYTINLDFKHSPAEAQEELRQKGKPPQFNIKEPFKSLWNIIVYVGNLLWDSITAVFKIVTNVADMKKFLNEIRNTLNEFLEKFNLQNNVLNNILNSILASLENVLTEIVGITQSLSNLVTGQGNILDVINSIFTAVNPLSDLLENFKNWVEINMIDEFKLMLQDIFHFNISNEGWTLINQFQQALSHIATGEWGNAVEDFTSMFFGAIYSIGLIFIGLINDILGFDLTPYWDLLFELTPILSSLATLLYMFLVMTIIRDLSQGNFRHLWEMINTAWTFLKTIINWTISVVSSLVNAVLSVINILVPF